MTAIFEVFALVMIFIFGSSVFTILDMCSRNVVMRNNLVFYCLILTATLSLLGVVFVDIKNILNQSKNKEEDRCMDT